MVLFQFWSEIVPVVRILINFVLDNHEFVVTSQVSVDTQLDFQVSKSDPNFTTVMRKLYISSDIKIPILMR